MRDSLAGELSLRIVAHGGCADRISSPFSGPYGGRERLVSLRVHGTMGFNGMVVRGGEDALTIARGPGIDVKDEPCRSTR